MAVFVDVIKPEAAFVALARDVETPVPRVMADGAADEVPKLPRSVLVPMFETLMVLPLAIVMSEPPTRDRMPEFDIVPVETAKPLPTITPPRADVVA